MPAPTLHQAFAALGYYSLGRGALLDLPLGGNYARPVFRGSRFVRPMTARQGWAYLAKVERKLAALRGARRAS